MTLRLNHCVEVVKTMTNKIAIVGKKKSGKTTLVEKLIPLLKEFGTVATIRSSPHEHELDHEGKDSCRHRLANSFAPAVMMTPTSVALFQDVKGPEERDSLVSRMLMGYNFILMEGNKRAKGPKIETMLDSAGTDAQDLICSDCFDDLVAVVSKFPIIGLPVSVKRFSWDEVEELAQLVAETLTHT